jgi:hypothetical protein
MAFIYPLINKKPASHPRNGVSIIHPYSSLLVGLAAKLEDGLHYLLGRGMGKIIHDFGGSK